MFHLSKIIIFSVFTASCTKGPPNSNLTGQVLSSYDLPEPAPERNNWMESAYVAHKLFLGLSGRTTTNQVAYQEAFRADLIKYLADSTLKRAMPRKFLRRSLEEFFVEGSPYKLNADQRRALGLDGKNF